jgi:hypothetical protein
MRLVLGLTAAAGLAALVLGLPAQAQGPGMNCYANVGGRSNCGLAANALLNRLSDDPAMRRSAVDARHLREVRGVDQAIKAGHCEEAVALARRSGDTLLAASAARICAAQASEPGPAAPRD